LKKYTGIDLSPVAIQMAEKQCPEFHFIAANALETDVFDTAEYDTAISFEFLEHVEDELSVLRRLAPGTRFWGTVPDFEYVSHVRYIFLPARRWFVAIRLFLTHLRWIFSIFLME
jgi:hypothetical protein